MAAMAACPACRAENPDGARFCSTCATPLGPVATLRDVRKVVSVLFADVIGSTVLGEQLDPETMRTIMGRYFAMMKAVIERHGGTVEKFIGDAVMAVFGIPTLHEDDALRAVRAAAEIATELATLNVELSASRGVTIQFRTGVNTGEVVAGDPATSQTLVTGDTVNTAARLEQAAAPGEILLGAITWNLVRDAVEVEQVEPIAAKGKALPISAYRLLSVRPGEAGRRRRLERPLVGRERELAGLEEAFRRAVDDRAAGLLTLLGTAGVGKSRLVAEFIAGLAGEATILRGHCLSYGEGITYWPIAEIVRSAAGINETDSSEGARDKLRAVLGDERDGDLLAARVGAAIGLSTEAAPQEEIFWAIRRLLERLARERSLVVVVEDIHWAEPTLLDLLEYIVDWSRDAPLLLLCPSRPDLLDERIGWGGARVNSTTLLLESLSDDASSRLIASLPGGAALPDPVVERIQDAAEGNPLYIEEFLSMLVDDGLLVEAPDGTWRAETDLAAVHVPVSISALLAARLEQLEPSERAVAERGSVVGRVFEAAAVSELADEGLRPVVGRSLLALVRKEFVRPDRSELSPGDAFRFRHILIRDAAYAALPKAERAELHERFADWLVRTAGERIAELEEIVGHHLDSAYRYRTELGEQGDAVEHLARRAAEHYLAAARRIRDRGDAAAATALLLAAEALPVADPGFRAELQLRLGAVLEASGRVAEARVRAEQALELATELGNHRLAARARILRLQISIQDGTLTDLDPDAAVEAAAALRDAELAGDAAALAEAYQTLGVQAYMSGKAAESREFSRLAIEQAWAAGDVSVALQSETNALVEDVVGWAPATEVLTTAEALLEAAAAYPSTRGDVLRLLAVLEAMVGRLDDARAHAVESVRLFDEMGFPNAANLARGDKSWVERLGDDLPAAERDLRTVVTSAAAAGDRTLLSWGACRLAQVLMEQGRLDDAEPYLEEAERVDMVMNRSRVLGARARLQASRGRPEAAELVAGLAEALEAIEFPNIRVDGFIDAAEATAVLGDRPRAVRYANEALRLAEAKGNVTRARQIRTILARIQP
jgi:predicted ATPase/class 3 adenylate cyclase